MIFGFGDFYLFNKFGTYEKKYFYNKLYVAVTRTRDELIIIDSNQAKADFWDEIINSFIATEWNKNHLQLNNVDELLISNSKSIVQSKNAIVEDDAKEQKDIGWTNKNIPLLKIASNHFLKIGNYEEYYYCLGLIAELGGDYIKASDLYLSKELVSNNGAKKRALYALWNGKYYERLKSILIVEGIERKILDCLSTVYLLKSEIFDETDISLLEDNIKTLIDIRKNTLWVEDFKQLFLSNILNDYQKDLHFRIYDILHEVFKETLTVAEREIVADVLFSNSQYNYALNIYENLNIRSINYYRSQAEIAKKRRKHEDYIISLGKIIYEDFAKNKEGIIDKKEIAQEIIYYYLENDLETSISPNDPYYYAYILLSKLYSSETNAFESLDEYEKVVSKFIEDGRENELLSFFYYLLEENSFTHLIYNKAINDWTKLYLKHYSLDDLNEEYKILCAIKEIPYVAFTDIEPILDIEHITSIVASNFRQFEQLEISDIGLINLIVGDNNIGKTSCLEMFLITRDPDEYYKRLLYCYVERSKIIPDKVQNTERTDYYYLIDHDFLFDFKKFGISPNPTFEVLSGRKIEKFNIIIDESQKTITNFSPLSFSKNKKKLDVLSYNEVLTLPYYSYGKGYGKDLAIAYDSYIRKDREIEVNFLNNLTLFIPAVENVLLTAEGGISIRITDEQIDKPLHSFGDGANKLFRILVLLTIHKGKLVLIDEIDSGIHFSRFKEFWEIIIKISSRDNTQVIATTHNLECINYFASAFSEDNRCLSRVIQLLKTNRLKSTTYDYENFKFALEDNFEIRG